MGDDPGALAVANLILSATINCGVPQEASTVSDYIAKLNNNTVHYALSIDDAGFVACCTSAT